MLSMNILKSVIRRTYVLTASSCKYRGIGRASDSSVTISCANMLKTLEEDGIFQQIDKKSLTSSSMDYDKKNVNAKYYQNNNNQQQQLQYLTFNNNNSIKQEYEEEELYYKEYEEAIKALNSLQSNAESLASNLQKRYNSLEDTQRCLERTGLTTKDLEQLSYIHVSGTKGKGSTCALVDSILRSYGVNTGFYSSPHLVSVTERFRLNGQPITKQKFTQYFWPVYDKLKATQEQENDMPAYFKFLTVLAFHIYLQEKVDVVILEVGIGGELDCTNVAPNTKTVGITSLGLEHTQLLGDTLEKIAWQKAGIIKPQSTVYTSVTQEECWQIIQQRAKEKQASVYRVPAFESYFKDPNLEEIKSQINSCTKLNGSLALQLAYDWLRQNFNGFHKEYEINKPRLTENAIKGILNSSWPGRCQKVKLNNFNIHLDGAHTQESMQVCGQWFKEVTANSKLPKILIFNTTGNRDSKTLLTILRKFSSFDLVCFVPNISCTSGQNNYDNQSVLYGQVEQMKRCQLHASDWQEMCMEANEPNLSKTFLSVMQCFEYLSRKYDQLQELNILVTGSIYLIGATILTLNKLPET